ncbi:hypothetical protein [Rhodopila sp.]|uniref:hypothetical protein n=1 Tax=Rhodopila sp. TaxID=2480087 RepID=UPI003D0B704E
MAVHKFSLGQRLVFKPGTEFMVRISARCSVTRLLPKEGAEYQYYVRTELDGQLRRVLESQLRDETAGPRRRREIETLIQK